MSTSAMLEQGGSKSNQFKLRRNASSAAPPSSPLFELPRKFPLLDSPPKNPTFVEHPLPISYFKRCNFAMGGMFSLFIVCILFTLLFFPDFTLHANNNNGVNSLPQNDVNILLLNVHKQNDILLVSFQNKATQQVHDFLLHLDTSLYAPDNHNLVPSSTYTSIHPTLHEFGTCQLLREGQIQGHFASPQLGGHFHILPPGSDNVHAIRRVLAEDYAYSDEVAPNPDVKPLLPRNKKKSTSVLLRSDVSELIPFFPGCFPNDEFPHSLSISIVVDQGLMDRINAKTLADVQLYVESFFGIVRVLYLTQLNVQLQVKQIVLPVENDSSLLGQTRFNGRCRASPLSTMYGVNAMLQANGLISTAASWHLLTDCHPSPGSVGASFIGGLCSASSRSSVTSWSGDSTWLTFAHELGHMFGAQHTFEMYGQGGVMDYGAGNYHNGPVQFNPLNQEDMCSLLTGLSQFCPQYFALARTEDQCGNGLLELGEECECLETGKLTCGRCKNCKLPSGNRKPQCSTGQFVMRSDMDVQGDVILVVSPSLLSHSDCCNNNDGSMATPPQACGLKQDGVCSSTGRCEKACAWFYIPSCGFEDNGCVQKCVYQNRCQGYSLLTQGPPPIPAGAVPNGLKCKLNNNPTGGVCQQGSCVVPVLKPTNAPITRTPTSQSPTSQQPTSVQPTSQSPTESRFPTLLPTSSPVLACPPERSFFDCPVKKKEADCVGSCFWCGGAVNKCLVSGTACARDKEWVSILYAHCPPFLSTFSG